MIDRSVGKGLFMINLAILGGITAVLLYQVPQPWRGLLVAWLVFLGTLGILFLKVLKHVYAYKSLKLTTHKSNTPAPRKMARRHAHRPAQTSLRVVNAQDVGRGRHTIT